MPFVALGIEGLIDLGVLAAFAFMVALDFAYALTLGVLLLGVAAALDSIASNLGPLGFLFSSPAGWIKDINNAIRSSIGTGIQATEYAWHKVLQFTASTLTGIGETMAYLAAETVRGFERMTTYLVPHLINTATRPLARAIANTAHVATSTAKTVPAEIVKVYRITKEYPRTYIQEVPRIAKAVTHAAATAAAVAGAITLPRLGPLERDVAAINKRLKELANVAGIGTLAGLGAYALSKLGLTESQCSNAKRWNKGMCGTNPNVIEDLLLGLTAIFGTLSLLSLAQQYQKVIGEVSGSVQHFWRADVKGPAAQRQLGQPGFLG